MRYSKFSSLLPQQRQRGQFVYVKVHQYCNRMSNNKKVETSKELHDKLEVDIAAYCKHKLNMKHKKNGNSFNQLFKGGEAMIQSIIAHNVHENIGPTQQGGISLLLFGHLTEQLNHNKSMKDPTGHRRWTVMMLQGEGVRTLLVCGHSPCRNNRLNSGTLYQQHRRYFINKKEDLTCPRRCFHDDLIEQLTKW
jgi:hypothetical protein